MSIWKELYQAYENKDCNKFKVIWTNLSDEDKNGPYFSKYQSLYSNLCPSSNKKWKILLKWKTIKCPHCGSGISKSTFNLESIKKLKQWAKIINFVCNYCGTDFTWSKKPFKTIFSDYTVWKEIKIKWNTYKLSWAVKYKWTYKEIWEWGWYLKYVEWLAYNEKWELFYISESRSKDDYWTYDSIEISKKVNFPFVIFNYDDYSIKTNLWTFENKETDTIKVSEIYGEVNKSYKIWEEIKIYNFQDYSLEIEATDNGIERNLYQRVWKIKSNQKEHTSETWDISDKLWIDNNFWAIDVIFFILSLIICPYLFLLSIILIFISHKSDMTDKLASYFRILLIMFIICKSSWWWWSYRGGGYSSSSWWSSSFGWWK